MIKGYEINEYEFTAYVEENDGLTNLKKNVSASLNFLKQIIIGEVKECVGYNHYLDMIDWLKINHPEKLL